MNRTQKKTLVLLLGILEGIAIKNGDADSMEFDEELYDEDDYAYDQYED